MKRNSLSTKLFAMLLCVVMVIGCLPLSAFATDWEGDIDLAPEGLNPENPIFLDLIYRWDNEETQEGLQVMFYNTDAEFDPTYFVTYGMPGQYSFSVTGEGDFSVTIDGEEIAAVEGVATKEITLTRGAGFNFAIDAGEGYFIEFLPVATEPPVGADFTCAAELAVNSANTATTHLNNWGEGNYCYLWTATADGVLTLSFNSYAETAVHTDIQMQIGSYEYLSENEDGTMEIDVVAGEQYGFIVVVVTSDMTASEFSIQADFEEALPTDANLVFANTALNLESAIGFQNVIMKKAYKDYDSFYVELVRDGKTTIVEPMLSNNYYTAYDIPVLPIDMTEEFTLTIYGVKEGVVYRGEVLTTSVMSFAMKLLEGYAQDESKAAVCRVLVDMLNYGAEVQKAFATEIGILANANLGEYASLGTTGDITINAAEVKTGTATVKILQDAFNLDARVEIQVLISNKTAPAGTVFRYTVGNAETVEIPVSEFTAYGSAYSYVAFSFAPLQFRETVVYGFYNPTTDEAVSEVYTTSIEACATEKLTDAAVGDLVVFMMKYGDATKAYVESLTA